MTPHSCTVGSMQAACACAHTHAHTQVPLDCDQPVVDCWSETEVSASFVTAPALQSLEFSACLCFQNLCFGCKSCGKLLEIINFVV